jgi:DNA-directed RNA polymerase specialized sigma24 family protein
MSAQRDGFTTRPDQEHVFTQDALRLQAVVSRAVRTSPANVEDACGFAWLQFVRHRPEPPTAFAWLCTTAVREAIELDRRARRAVGLDQVSEVPADRFLGPAGRLELIATGEQIRAARLRLREARVLGLRAAGYSRGEIAERTGDSHRTIDRQLGRARRKVEQARRPSAEVA